MFHWGLNLQEKWALQISDMSRELTLQKLYGSHGPFRVDIREITCLVQSILVETFQKTNNSDVQYVQDHRWITSALQHFQDSRKCWGLCGQINIKFHRMFDNVVGTPAFWFNCPLLSPWGGLIIRYLLLHCLVCIWFSFCCCCRQDVGHHPRLRAVGGPLLQVSAVPAVSSCDLATMFTLILQFDF